MWVFLDHYGSKGAAGGAGVFCGVNTLNLDAKGRMAMPSKYRDRLASMSDGQLVVTVDRDCLLVYPLPDWEVVERKLVKLPSYNPQARRLQRLLMGYATECELDGNGRILLPQPLREFANLEKRVVLIGQGNRFELWNEDTWNNNRDQWLTDVGKEELDLPDELGSFTL